MTASDTLKLDAVPHRVTHPQRIPAQRYYDAEFFELEREKLWPHIWQMACRLEEIPEVGDWVEYKILDKSVIVVRTPSGVKAFHNACRHRGVKLASGRGNCEVQGFTCPFHGWRWNTEGKNTFVFARQVFDEANLDAAELNLVPCRIELWGGCAFINFDNDAPGFRESMGPVLDKLDARKVDQLKMEWWYATELPTNWKLAMEAFMEGYHVMRTHPQLYAHMMVEMSPYGLDAGARAPERRTTPREFVDKTLKFFATNGEGMAGMITKDEVAIAESLRDMALPDDLGQAAGAFYARVKDEIYQAGLARGLPVFDMNKADAENGFTYVEFMFPHFFLLPFFSAMSSYRIRPLTPETCLFEIWSLVPMAEDDPRPRVTQPVVLPHDSPDFPEIPRQDYSNLPIQQEGLHAQGFDYMRLSSQKEGMISNYQRLIDGYLAGLEAQKLAKASRTVNSGFEAPVLDIGF
ncbi:aromatic ring-hydroxylating dioxygenase subunit alpha [Phenylobacterium sp. LjRoot219]|uniref:aromatic ring-hydroxylating oxygenase subunit alpha n=1 Tax=Phenylobacterium sp. LjRoot219 TaxID=3342283 RepID=UPI003ECD0DFA